MAGVSPAAAAGGADAPEVILPAAGCCCRVAPNGRLGLWPTAAGRDRCLSAMLLCGGSQGCSPAAKAGVENGGRADWEHHGGLAAHPVSREISS